MSVRQELTASVLTDLLFEEPGVGRCLVAPDGSIVRVNADWLRSTGFTADEVLGADILALFPETRDMAAAMHARVRAGHRVEVPRHAQRIQGRETWWEGSIAPVPMTNGTGLLITAREVSPSARNGLNPSRIEPLGGEELELRRSEERFRLLTEAMPQIVCVLLPDGTPEYVNSAWARYSGLDVKGTAHAGWANLHPDDLPVALECRRRTLKSLEPQDAELRYRSKDGTYRWFLSRLAPVAENGRAVRLVGAAMDIDDRKRAEAALRESERRYRTMGETLPYGVWLCNPQGGAEYVSQSFLDLLEMTQEEMRDFGWTHRLPPEEVQPMLDEWLHCVRTGTPWDSEHRVLGPDGRYHHVLTRGLPVRDDKGEITCWVGINLDIDDRKRTEAALERSEAAFEHAGKLARFGAWWVELAADGTVREARWSDEVYRIFGYDPGELPASLERWREHLHPDDRVRVEESVADAVAAGRPFVLEHRIVTRTGAERIVAVHGEARIDGHHGTPIAIIGAIQDVTERKRIEQELRDTGRRKDEFLGMLSHELRNPLAPIRNSMFVVRRAPPGSAQAARAHDVIERQTEHLTRLVDDLLDVTRIAHGRIELRRSRIDLREVVSRTADDFRQVFDDRRVDLHVELPEGELWADADPTRIAQVVGNLLHNAAKFTRGGDRAAISLARRGTDAEIRVRDTGAGMDAALLPRVFEAFTQGDRTLSRSEGGLGLGLALVKAIAELHGGTARAASAGKGRGAEFTVVVPIVPPASAPGPCAGRVDGPPASRRVLVVEDNRDSAESLAQVVTLLGHVVEVAYDGTSALTLAGARPFDVVLCDLGLPGMSGYDVAKALRSRGTRARLVALSGYAQQEDVQAAIEAGFDLHLAKPGTIADLERLLS